MTLDEQVALLNRVSYITRLGCINKKPLSPSQALDLLLRLNVRR